MLDVFFAVVIEVLPQNLPATPADTDITDTYAFEVGDDNGNGVIEEDESGFSRVNGGNRICGPGKANGVPAGMFDDGGVFIDAWPVGVAGE